MPCPVTTILGAGAVFGGVHTLLVQDRAGRPFAWALLLGLLAGWTAYVLAGREPAVRVALEVASVCALLAGAWRVRRLARRHGVRSPLAAVMTRVLRGTWSVVGAPGVLVVKVWLLAMLVMEWRGKARFDALEYALVALAALALVAWRVRSLRRAPRFAALESFAGTPAPACPLGFGCAAPASTATRGAAAGDASRRLTPEGA